MTNKYSLNAKSYGISKVKWREIKELVISFDIDSSEARIRFKLNEVDKANKTEVDEELCKMRVWFLYDVLLQEKYNHLYKREKLINPKVGDFVYCDYEGFGRGAVIKIYPNDLIEVKFDNRSLTTFCANHTISIDEKTKIKITRL